MCESMMPFVLSLVCLLWSIQADAQLSVNYYANSCPNVESIVDQVMQQKFKLTPNSVPGTLRLFFHDCFVEGCDASVLIASTGSNKAEKDADINDSLAGDGFDSVLKAKAAVEAQCPGVVSCADILAIATRDLVKLAGGPFWNVQKGRRDGLVSQASRVDGNLPLADQSIGELTKLFKSKGLDQTDIVALSGNVSDLAEYPPLYRMNIQTDPTLDPDFANNLRLSCPRTGLDPRIVVNNDVTTPARFDNVYYQNARRGVAVLSSDQILFSDTGTKPLVNSYADDQDTFFAAFAASMIKLGAVGVKTGTQGEIRKDCAAFNS